MKELFKNKAIIAIFILMLGFTYIKTEPANTLEDTNKIEKEEIVYKNK